MYQANVHAEMFVLSLCAEWIHQVRHDVRQPVVVVPLDPNHLNLALRIRQLADIPQKLPVILGQPGKIKVGKNIAQ